MTLFFFFVGEVTGKNICCVNNFFVLNIVVFFDFVFAVMPLIDNFFRSFLIYITKQNDDISFILCLLSFISAFSPHCVHTDAHNIVERT